MAKFIIPINCQFCHRSAHEEELAVVRDAITEIKSGSVCKIVKSLSLN
jgi:hypothetical protein